jgi:hypothetical protein
MMGQKAGRTREPRLKNVTVIYEKNNRFLRERSDSVTGAKMPRRKGQRKRKAVEGVGRNLLNGKVAERKWREPRLEYVTRAYGRSTR